ncbi:hypothetical protein QYF61_005019 [Mycteria americana]|uniref:DEP domain-containing protein n=1 Tax=Mycteria americana TaxID=33587 RepID=A0AAN7P3U8_MYCAM|nr:hypothetical protein QYF61_005019 [Mycteria americana]
MPGAVVPIGIAGISLLTITSLAPAWEWSEEGGNRCISFDRAPATLSRRISNPYLETPSNKIYGESSSCAGRALRNIFTLQASDLIKDRVYLTGICRRSCVGSELVDWLLEQCPFVKCRSTAVGVWQLLLDMGIILSVDRQLYFQDTHAFYQFSADECTYLFCEFEKEEGWKKGVKLLLQLLPLSSPRIDMCNLPDQKIEDTAETNAEILARLTSAHWCDTSRVLGPVLNSQYKRHMDVLECMRMTMKMIRGVAYLTYKERLRELGVELGEQKAVGGSYQCV